MNSQPVFPPFPLFSTALWDLANSRPVHSLVLSSHLFFYLPCLLPLRADAEIKVPSCENTELKRSPFKAWSRSIYNNTCYAYCQGSLLCLFLPFRSFPLHFFQNLFRFFPVLAAANTGSCAGPQNKLGHPAGCRLPS